MNDLEYWKECISIAAEECDLKLTAEQLDHIAASISGWHENYGMAFYSPPSSERLDVIERECAEKLARQQREHEQYVNNAEAAVKRALRVHRDDQVSIGKHGEVLRHGGRTERIQ